MRLVARWLPLTLLLLATPAARAASPAARWQAAITKGLQFEKQGQIAQAAKSFSEAVKAAEKLGAGDRRLATSLNDLGVVSMYQGKARVAESLFRRALAIRQKALGPDHPAVAQSLNNLAALLNDQGQSQAAEKLYQRALTIEQKALHSDHFAPGGSLVQFARFYTEGGESTEAEPMIQRALALEKRATDQPHDAAARRNRSYALLLRAAGRESEARAAESRGHRSGLGSAAGAH